MTPSERPLHLRIFLAAPSDVAHERVIARETVGRLQHSPLVRGRATLEVVAWEESGGETPLPASMMPGKAIESGLPRPSQCDIVIVILWARMGTPLPESVYVKPDGTPYVSGTEWEYLDAVRGAEEHSGRPQVLVYRCDRQPSVLLDDPDKGGIERRWQSVKEFFAGISGAESAFVRGYSSYSSAEDLRPVLHGDLEKVLQHFFDSGEQSSAQTVPTATPASQRADEAPVPWDRAPYPGLRPFRTDESDIYFGRDREIDQLVDAVRSHRFVTVVGDAGTGKSSLVAAGLLPRLQENAIAGSRDWVFVRVRPAGVGDDPLLALGVGLANELERQDRPRDLAAGLTGDPEELRALVQEVLGQRPPWAELLLVVDQLEEAFSTRIPNERRQSFLDLLAKAGAESPLRTLVTVRSDFYQRCLEYPPIAELLRSGSFPLGSPTPLALAEMIEGPAERGGIRLTGRVVERILEDAASEPGRLPLVAFALEQLALAISDERTFTRSAYDELGGVRGAIDQRAEEVYGSVGAGARQAFEHAFARLIDVDRRNIATRQRGLRQDVAATPEADELVSALVDAGLLTSAQDERGGDVVEVAHESLFTSWQRLAEWIEGAADEFRLLQRVRLEAADWDRAGRPTSPGYLWPHELLERARVMVERLRPELDECERYFIRPEAERLLEELQDVDTTHARRFEIGERLGEIGDPRPGLQVDEDGTPAFDWCDVGGGTVVLEDDAGTFGVEPFRIARYPVTEAQFLAFVEAWDGSSKLDWWDDPASRGGPHTRAEVPGNRPATSVSWFDAVSFCRWVTARLGFEVRLPTEWEWQQAARGGDPANEFPWGPGWDDRFANASEGGPGRAVAVGMYPHGVSPDGALDMAGNAWEWCANQYHSPQEVTTEDPKASRVLRGGSFYNPASSARCTYRGWVNPSFRVVLVGFRVVAPAP